MTPSDAMAAPLSTVERADAQALETVLEKILDALPAGVTTAWRVCRLCDHATCEARSCPVEPRVP